MPPKIKITKDEILNVAIRIVQEKGIESLNARDLAKEIGCSVHPIFRTFESMEGLKSAVYQMAEHIYNQCMLSSEDHKEDGFLGMGLTYIDFAKNEKNLFKLLFMSDAFREQSMMDIVGSTEGDDEVIGMLSQRTGLSSQSAKELYAGIWLTTHGIASMFATNNCRFSDEEIRRLLNNSFMGLMMKLKKEEGQNQ
ncbi:TetR/AcrR family transcriptional regulator [Paenibacillus puldeungensis]|uniref:TetR/AcrR family transcriptional regulator n=1 Tax=Paenibacillus puldeungensis TaxID=696536 RepID=A0ABW3RU45_9BACL